MFCFQKWKSFRIGKQNKKQKVERKRKKLEGGTKAKENI